MSTSDVHWIPSDRLVHGLFFFKFKFACVPVYLCLCVRIGKIGEERGREGMAGKQSREEKKERRLFTS